MSDLMPHVQLDAITSAGDTLMDPAVALIDKLVLLALVVKLLSSSVGFLDDDQAATDAALADLTRAVSHLSHLSRTVLWICQNCGTPTEESRLTWPLRAGYLGCPVCKLLPNVPDLLTLYGDHSL